MANDNTNIEALVKALAATLGNEGVQALAKQLQAAQQQPTAAPARQVSQARQLRQRSQQAAQAAFTSGNYRPATVAAARIPATLLQSVTDRAYTDDEIGQIERAGGMSQLREADNTLRFAFTSDTGETGRELDLKVNEFAAWATKNGIVPGRNDFMRVQYAALLSLITPARVLFYQQARMAAPSETVYSSFEQDAEGNALELGVQSDGVTFVIRNVELPTANGKTIKLGDMRVQMMRRDAEFLLQAQGPAILEAADWVNPMDVGTKNYAHYALKSVGGSISSRAHFVMAKTRFHVWQNAQRSEDIYALLGVGSAARLAVIAEVIDEALTRTNPRANFVRGAGQRCLPILRTIRGRNAGLNLPRAMSCVEVVAIFEGGVEALESYWQKRAAERGAQPALPETSVAPKQQTPVTSRTRSSARRAAAVAANGAGEPTSSELANVENAIKF